MIRRSWLTSLGVALGVAIAAPALVACGGETGASVAIARGQLSGESRLVKYFAEAEAETGVPAEVLASIAWMQTKLDARRAPAAEEPGHAHHHTPDEWGVMAIGTGGLTTTARAARLAGLREDAVKTDARANVLAAAALLAEMAEARGLSPAQAGDFDVLAAYGGEALAESARRLVGRGFAGTDDEGKSVELIGTGEPGSEIGVARLGIGYPDAKWSAASSSNYKNASRTAADISMVVIHTTQGSYAGTINWFKNPSAQVSAHYVIRSSDGQITQMVDDRDVAWHVGNTNSKSIGIEHEGFVAEPKKWYTPEMYAASAKLTAWLCDAYGIPKDRTHIIGHVEAPGATHTDPGTGWDWKTYMALVKSGGVDPDQDADGIPNADDNCPDAANGPQLDTDGDGKGDACETDDDGDGVLDETDNCPKADNADQADWDDDGKGDACSTPPPASTSSA